MEAENTVRHNKNPAIRHAVVWMLVVLGAGVLVRLYAAWTLPLSNDELGTVTGAALPFSDYFDQLVSPDGHPPGYRLFFFAWLNVVGTGNELLVRLPVLLAACGGLWFLYKGLENVAGSTAALAGLIVIAFSDLIAYTTVLVRPYGFGFLAIAALFWSLSRLDRSSAYRWQSGIPIAVSWALLMYTHFFAILTGVLLTAGWLFYMKPHSRKLLLGASFAGCLLFVPAVPLFFEQIGRSGLNWLPEPSLSFGWRYLHYLFNHSIVWLVVLVLGGIVGFTSLSRRQRVAAGVLLATGMVVYLVGYIWSIWQKPVLQYNVLIFSSLFLVGSLAMGWGGIKKYMQPIGLAVLFVIGLWSLFLGQQFLTKEQFGDFQKQARFIEAQVQTLEAEGIPYAVFAHQNNPNYLHYYLSDSVPLFNYKGYFSSSLQYINTVIDSLQPQAIISAWNNVAQAPITEAWIQYHFPLVSDSLFTFNGGTSVYRKGSGTGSQIDKYLHFNCREIAANLPMVLSVKGDTAHIAWSGQIEKDKVSHVVAYAEVSNGNLGGESRCRLYDTHDAVVKDQAFPWFYYPLRSDSSRLLVMVVELPGDVEVHRVEWGIWSEKGEQLHIKSMSIHPVCDHRYRYLHPRYWYPRLY